VFYYELKNEDNQNDALSNLLSTENVVFHKPFEKVQNFQC